MSETPCLALPLLEAAQAQKHITHNEALLLLDGQVHLAVLTRGTAAPPATPADGDRYLVATGASGDWAGQDGAVAFFEGDGWRFTPPHEGWRLWVSDEKKFLIYSAGGWRDILAIDVLQNMTMLGVNASADATNRLAVKSPAVLIDNQGAGIQLKLNKNAASDTGSLLYQTAYSGRAEMGLAGDDDFHIKVSADGSTWREALRVDRATGAVSMPYTAAGGIADGSRGDITVSAAATVWTVAASAITNAKLAAMPARSLKGNAAASAGAATDLTPAEVNALLGTWAMRLAGHLALP